MLLSIQTHLQNLSFSMTITAPSPLFLNPKPPHLSLQTNPKLSIIRMGGGPRTYPGGVSKWQWKRMQAKKAKQLLKARLCRERQIYEMRKRAELKAAVSELERPWEVVERAPNLFSVSADEQLKVLADRFQKPGGFDMWSDKDGPQLFQSPDELPSARFFPKGVVHSVRPYGRISGTDELEDGYRDVEGLGLGDGNRGLLGERRSGYGKFTEGRELLGDGSGSDSESLNSTNSFEPDSVNGEVGKQYRGSRLRRKGNGRRRFGSADSNGSSGWSDSEQSADMKQRWQKNPRNRRSEGRYSRGNGSLRLNKSQSDVYDMRLQQDGSYGIQSKNG